jgi:excisionase family DNA binding protein
VSEKSTDPADAPAASRATPVGLFDRHRRSPLGGHAGAATPVSSLDELAADPARAAALLQETAMALGDRAAFDASPRPLRGHRTGTADVKTLDNSGSGSRHTDRQSVDRRPGRRLLTLREAACYLGISPWTLRELTWKGSLPVVRMTRKLHFDLQDLDRFIEASKDRL